MREFGSGQMRLGVEDELNSYTRFCEKVEIADVAFKQFREMQTQHGLDAAEFAEGKKTLRERLKALEDELNRYLAKDNGVDVGKKAAYEKWLASQQPFHWFIEFYGIMSKGGFGVAIGNPPYVVISPEKVTYDIKESQFVTYSTKNLYALAYERSLQLARKSASLGLIVQLTALSSERMPPLQDLLLQRGLLIAPAFPRRPESIFDGVEMPVTILISRPQNAGLHTSRISGFYTDERPHALATLRLQHSERLYGHRIAKIGTALDAAILTTFERHVNTLASL